MNKGTAGNQMPIPSGGQKATQPTGSSGRGSQLQAAPEPANGLLNLSSKNAGFDFLELCFKK